MIRRHIHYTQIMKNFLFFKQSHFFLFAFIFLFQHTGLARGDRYEKALKSIRNEFIRVENDETLDWRVKHTRLIGLYDAMMVILTNRERDIQKKINEEVQRQLEERRKVNREREIEAAIFKKYLFNNASRTSFQSDFHTLRY